MSYSLRTAPSATYISPTRDEMRVVADKVGLKSFSRDLVTDLGNLAAGGSICPPSSYRRRVIERVEEHLPAPDSQGKWQLSSGQWSSDRFEVIQDRGKKAMQYHQNVCDFLQTVELQKFPGNSPLEQAMNLLKLLSEKKGGSGGGEGGEPLPIFTENDMSEKVGEGLNHLMDEVDSLSEDEKDLLDPDQDAGLGDSENGDDGLQKMKLAMDMAKGKDAMLEISRNLDSLSRMQVRKSKKQESDPAGEEIRQRPIAHMGELNKVSKPSWAKRQASPSYFLYQAITGALPVRERVTIIEKKQLLYIIIDCSGSMGSGKRIFKAGGILMNRLKAVIADEAELYVRFFDSSLKEEHHASTSQEAKELIKHFTEKNYSGGGTDISGCARSAQKRIEEIVAEGATYRPELVVITDGDDSINLTTKDFAGTKMHSFVVECSNKALSDLAVKTGGVGINNL